MTHNISKVLLVDDDTAMNYVNEFFLKHYKYCENVVVEQYSEDALEKMKTWASESPNELPQLIFIDLNMPVLSGYDLAEAFYHHIPAHLMQHIHVYILTSSDLTKEINHIQTLPFIKGCLNKPIKIDDLDRIFNRNIQAC